MAGGAASHAAALADAAEELARLVVPVIGARLERLGERYARIADDVRRLGSAAALAGPWEDGMEGLEGEETEVHAAGFVLGVLAAACGTDVLRARRLAGGPRAMVELVCAARGVQLVPGPEGLPAACPGGGGWEGTFALGLLFAAASAEGAGTLLAWSATRRAPDAPGPASRGEALWSLRLSGASAAPLRAAADALLPLGCRAGDAPDAVELPARWFAGAG